MNDATTSTHQVANWAKATINVQLNKRALWWVPNQVSKLTWRRNRDTIQECVPELLSIENENLETD